MTQARDLPDLRIQFLKDWGPRGEFTNGFIDRVHESQSDPSLIFNTIDAMRSSVAVSTLFWIDHDCIQLLVQAAKTLPDLQYEQVRPPSPDGLLVFGSPPPGFTIKRFTGDDGISEVRTDTVALTWATRSDGTLIEAYEFLTLGPKRAWLNVRSSSWAPGSVLSTMVLTDPDDDSAPRVTFDRRLIAALGPLLEQRIVTEHCELGDRAVRRRCARADVPSDVRIVRLRRVVHPDGSGEGPGLLVDWSHRWVVNGHWRNQACGAERADRRLIWVAPHIKGPDDKPLIVKDTVNALVR